MSKVYLVEEELLIELEDALDMFDIGEVSEPILKKLRAILEKGPSEPVAWIEHHKAGDNLNWERIDRCRIKDTPLYRKDSHD
jgi:hypothetical protein